MFSTTVHATCIAYMDMERKLQVSIVCNFQDATIIFFVKGEVGRRQPYWIPYTTIHATFTSSCHINYTGLKTCRWNQKRRFYLKRFPRYDNFSKSNMAAVAKLDF